MQASQARDACWTGVTNYNFSLFNVSEIICLKKNIYKESFSINFNLASLPAASYCQDND